MTNRVFLDSNVLIYAATGKDAYPDKFDRANDILGEAEFGISTQVVGEFVKNVRDPRKMRASLSDVDVHEWLDRLFLFPVVSIDRDIIERAMYFQTRYKINYWDGQILAAAERFQADILYSEDLKHQENYAGIQCLNPFANPRDA
jgi:predicted nucleic acid-binding protein